jgi:SPASM domain peptide maturase of grasp-with-spasm system
MTQSNLQELRQINYRFNPNALLVNGTSRGLICDIERGTFLFVPNALVEILHHNKSGTIDKVIQQFNFNSEEQDDLLDYFELLIKNDLIFFTSFPEYYTDLKLDWDYNSKIHNAIIDFNIESKFSFVKIFSQLAELGCVNIQIRAFDNLHAKIIENLLISINETVVETIQLVLPFVSQIQINDLRQIATQYSRLRFVQIYNSPIAAEIYVSDNESTGVYQITESVISKLSCGIISTQYFSPVLSTITESHHHNSCLNRKISIDVDGNIKNCPSMTQSFGNIRDQGSDSRLQGL